MKILIATILTTILASGLFGATTTKELNPHLLDIFEQMKAEAKANELGEKEFEADLRVKVASKKFLIFSDAYLQADEETKYQIGKWIFTPDQVAGLEAKRGDIVTVKFKIDEVRTKAPYADMPHFVATILSITHSKVGVDPDGAINSEATASPR